MRTDKKKKIGRPWPKWAHTLDDGVYTVDDILLIVDRTRSSIRNFMNKNCFKKSHALKDGHVIAYYEWRKPNREE